MKSLTVDNTQESNETQERGNRPTYFLTVFSPSCGPEVSTQIAQAAKAIGSMGAKVQRVVYSGAPFSHSAIIVLIIG